MQSLSPKELQALPRGVSSTLSVAWVRTRGHELRKKLNMTQWPVVNQRLLLCLMFNSVGCAGSVRGEPGKSDSEPGLSGMRSCTVARSDSNRPWMYDRKGMPRVFFHADFFFFAFSCFLRSMGCSHLFITLGILAKCLKMIILAGSQILMSLMCLQYSG